jgi:hypothetical protein
LSNLAHFNNIYYRKYRKKSRLFYLIVHCMQRELDDLAMEFWGAAVPLIASKAINGI